MQTIKYEDMEVISTLGVGNTKYMIQTFHFQTLISINPLLIVACTVIIV